MTDVELRKLYPVEYNTWTGMNQRCYDPKLQSYRRYGGRGIKVHPEWRRGERGAFLRFIQYIRLMLGERPYGYTLDRIDNNKNYEPGNLKWSTFLEQSNNRRTNLRMVVEGVEYTSAADFARALGIGDETVRSALRRGRSPEWVAANHRRNNISTAA